MAFGSNYKGVTKGRIRQKDNIQMWVSQFCFGGEHLNLGWYEDEVVAAMAFDRAALMAGKKTWFNFDINGGKYPIPIGYAVKYSDFQLPDKIAKKILRLTKRKRY